MDMDLLDCEEKTYEQQHTYVSTCMDVNAFISQAIGSLCDNKNTIYSHRAKKRCCFNNCHRDNALHTHDSITSEKDIAMTGFLPLTNYSLLHPDSATNGETLVDGEDKHCTCGLERNNGGTRLKKNKRGSESYSKLCYNTA